MTPSLQGKKVLVPRGKNNAKSFSAIVENFGGVPIEVPLLDFRATQNIKELIPTLEELSTYDWLILTSNVAVNTFFAALGDIDVSKLPKIAAIGEKTEGVLKKKGISVQFIPKAYVAESFAEEFAEVVKEGERILIPKGNLARDYIAQFFQKRGHVVDEIIIYETYFPEESKKRLIEVLQKGELEILPFTSPSTIEHFMQVVHEYELKERIEHCLVAAIGPVSKKKCEKLGLTVHIMPEVYTSFHMLTAVAEYLEKQ